jgi:hypothetical protein
MRSDKRERGRGGHRPCSEAETVSIISQFVEVRKEIEIHDGCAILIVIGVVLGAIVAAQLPGKR